MLATDLARISEQSGYEVICLSHQELDITQADKVEKAMSGIKPNCIVNTVGIGVDLCETNPEHGYQVHTWGTGCLARNAQRIGATLVQISSCGLFGDEIKYYSEYDSVVLKTKYAHSKYLGEMESRTHCQRLFIIRCGWLFGGTSSHLRNFVFQRFKEAKDKPVVMAAGDKFGSPTSTKSLSGKILEILETQEYGIYHVTNQGGGSRYDYVKCIVEAFGLHTIVEKADSSHFPRPAHTPASEMLKNLNLGNLGLPLLEPWEDAIGRYVTQLKKEVGL